MQLAAGIYPTLLCDVSRDVLLALLNYHNKYIFCQLQQNEYRYSKKNDRLYYGVESDFERAKTEYHKRQKRTQKNKSAEGTSYFATPEPLGQKMVEWADVRGGERLLEPSAGHGAIAQWVPENVALRAIEQSVELASRLALKVDSQNIITGSFSIPMVTEI